ncbi:MAG: hypothetical protein CL868_14830 [Cytophagaceae bacterium]|nr:hypothetical protein [Cytophagaceae bacterium]|tara:strand:+ start:84 stop:458 length:375 start_codon:yes stop_codon:yes gene_type:complete
MSKNKITLNTAEEWTTKWRGEGRDFLAKNKLNAFLIPAEDLMEVLKELKVEKGQKYVRAYLGLTEDNTAKLAIVGTEEATDAKGNTYYKDLLPKKEDGIGVEGEGIYDLTSPCPPDCDPTSPLV